MTDATQTGDLTDGFHLVIDALKLNDIEHDLRRARHSDHRFRRAWRRPQACACISFRHEQNAGNAAAIAGFLTKKPGICLTVSAPGFLNGLTALAHATTNCFPMILIRGSSEREIVDLQQGDYEEMDQLAIAKPLCKAAYRVLHAEDIGIGIARAIRAAVSGRPGGVYLDLPATLSRPDDGRAEGDEVAGQGDRSGAARRSRRPTRSTRALDVLQGRQAAADHPRQGRRLRPGRRPTSARFVEKSGIPYLPMIMAKGLLPDTHPQSAGPARSLVLKEADVVMLIGARLNWLLSHGKGKTWGAPHSKQVRPDRHRAEGDGQQRRDRGAAGRRHRLLRRGAAGRRWATTGRSRPPTGPSAVTRQEGRQRRNDGADAAEQHRADELPRRARRAARRSSPSAPTPSSSTKAPTRSISRARIVDMYKPRKRLDVGTWGVMGIGMGSAIAAAVETGKPVLAVEGDSAFGFSGMEVETICRYNLPVCVVVFNNNGIYRGTDVNPSGGADVATTVFVKDARYDKMMEAFGGVGVYADDPGRAGTRRERGDGSRQADAGQRGHRPDGRHRERPHRQSEPAKRGRKEVIGGAQDPHRSQTRNKSEGAGDK